jgi:hypothetical protein
MLSNLQTKKHYDGPKIRSGKFITKDQKIVQEFWGYPNLHIQTLIYQTMIGV